jgi:predicted NBD/HSP70 family sugar kinase
LEKLLGKPIRIANDADCFALSEATDGAGAGAETVFGVILGTGVGAGVVVRGHLLSGPNSIAGEWGHNPLPWPRDEERPGPACYCGRSGCIETFLSGPGLALSCHLKKTCGAVGIAHPTEDNDQHGRVGYAHHMKYPGNPPDALGTQRSIPPGERLDSTTLGDANPQAMTAADIARGAASGDASCELEMQLYEDRLARALAHVINILDPHVIVLGGGLSNCARLYENVPKLWGRYVFSDRVDTRLVPPRFGDSSGVRGAAWLWAD